MERGQALTSRPRRHEALTPARARTTLVSIRLLLAALTWAMPRLGGRLFGIDTSANPAAPYLARLYGARSGLMAVDLLAARDEERARELGWRHVVVDGVDIVASVIGGQRRQLQGRATATTASTALLLLLLGVRARGRTAQIDSGDDTGGRGCS